ncbi:Hypothetical predicted protein, partial [Mytilus galloprovincialis]
SIKTKQCQVKNLVEGTHPDIVIGTETWIDSSIKDSQIFPSGYKIYRKDRQLCGGGVLIAIKDTYISSPVPELDTDCEIIWCKIELAGQKNMYISSFYNPKTANEPGYLEYKGSIDQTASIKNCFIVSGGDFNLPGWDWKANCLKDNTQHVGIHQRFGDILDDNGLLQIVEEPTRQTNTLDLLITNHPNSFTRVEILPGVSDHDIVFAEISVIPSRKKQAARKIHLYSKANWDTMREDINNIKNEIETMTTSKSNINDIWLVFKTSLEKSVNLNIPHKQARTKDSPPCISRDLRRLIRKRDRLYKKKKKSHDKKDSEKYKTIKRQVQQGLRRSYWKYVESIVTPPEDNIIENRGSGDHYPRGPKHNK